MSKKMSVMGVGGKIGVILILSLTVTAGLHYLFTPTLHITENYTALVIAAVAAVVVGFSLNLVAAFGMLRAHQRDQLATGGLYAIFLNPMYTVMLLITVPGLLLLFNAWLVLLTIVPTFIAFKVFAREEERYLEAKFGRQYQEYRGKVLFRFL